MNTSGSYGDCRRLLVVYNQEIIFLVGIIYVGKNKFLFYVRMGFSGFHLFDPKATFLVNRFLIFGAKKIIAFEKKSKFSNFVGFYIKSSTGRYIISGPNLDQ